MLFGTDGIVTILTSLYFRLVGNQQAYMIFICVALSIDIVVVAIFVPESPKYLYER